MLAGRAAISQRAHLKERENEKARMNETRIDRTGADHRLQAQRPSSSTTPRSALSSEGSSSEASRCLLRKTPIDPIRARRELCPQGPNKQHSSVGTFQTYYQSLYRTIQTRSIPSPQTAIQNIRNLGPVQLATAGVIFAEALGFFTVGEMIGRFKIVGYHGETAHH